MLMMHLSLIETQEDKSKFEELYYHYRKNMYLCAKRILKNEILAEDAVHDAFIRIIKYLKEIEDVRSDQTKNLIIVIVEI